MGNATQIKVWRYGLHKHNAVEKLEDSEKALESSKEQLIALAATAPCAVEHDNEYKEPWHMYVVREINEILEWRDDEVINMFTAANLLTDPDEALDELVDSDWPSAEEVLSRVIADKREKNEWLLGIHCSEAKTVKELFGELKASLRDNRNTIAEMGMDDYIS